MTALTHGFRIEQDLCRGCLACMRVCPTRAIRVRGGVASFSPEQCIDCGTCLPACPSGAITATTWSVRDLSRFKFKVAVPSPILFGQFPAGITPDDIVRGLLLLGFDAVWDYGVEIALVERAIKQYVDKWEGSFPLVSISCPVVVRLVQVTYPRMVDRLICIQPPRELAGRALKQRYSAELGLPESEIAAIYITPCQAKTISVLEPAEGVASHLDGTLGIADVYNAIVASAKLSRTEPPPPRKGEFVRSSAYLQWSLGNGLGRVLSRERYLHVTGLANVTQVFDDIESGRLRNVQFVEAHSCWNACSGGNLTVANIYVTLSKLRALMRKLPVVDAETRAELKRRYPVEEFALEQPIRARLVRGSGGSLKERVRIVQEAEAILSRLPGYNCGLCGAPTCRDMAKDVSIGDAPLTDCVFHSRDRVRVLRKVRARGPGAPPTGDA